MFYTVAVNWRRVPRMKNNTRNLLVAAGVALLFSLAASPMALAQAPSAANGDAGASFQVLALIDALTEQNKQLAANQAALDAKIDALAETIRQARLFAARSGGKGGAK